jgi:hypothetical protein
MPAFAAVTMSSCQGHQLLTPELLRKANTGLVLQTQLLEKSRPCNYHKQQMHRA